jgi:hypothetical protein
VGAQGLRRAHCTDAWLGPFAGSWHEGTLLADRQGELSAMLTKTAPASDDLPCDLLDFLAQERGIEAEMAVALLGDFLLNYEPLSAASRGRSDRLAA